MTQQHAFEEAYLSLNGFHTKAELAREWMNGHLSSEMFRAGWQAATEAAKATGTAGERPALTGNDVIEMIVGHLVSVVGGRNLMKGEEIGFSLDDLVFVANAAAARQPAPVADQLKLICAGFGWRTDGDSNVLADRIEHHIRDMKAGIKARDTVIAERDAALSATAAPVLSDEQIGEIADNFKFKDHWQSNAEAIRFARAILAATNRSQP